MKVRVRLLLVASLSSALCAGAAPTQVTMPAASDSPISAGVGLPAGRALFWTGGTVAAPLNKDGRTVHERFGDTYAQGISALKNIGHILVEQGLSLKDVVYLRVYVAPDLEKDAKPDFAGWARAYGLFFDNERNPMKAARTTVGVPPW
ncbi:MAG TPA: Rid family hydrolase [Lacunisphaera sp.]